MCFIFFRFTYKWSYKIFVIAWFILFSRIPSRSFHVFVNGKIYHFYVCVCVRMYVHIYMCMCLYEYLFMHVNLCIYGCVHVYVCACVCICVYLCVCVCVLIPGSLTGSYTAVPWFHLVWGLWFWPCTIALLWT